jgi:hypothetical protein
MRPNLARKRQNSQNSPDLRRRASSASSPAKQVGLNESEADGRRKKKARGVTDGSEPYAGVIQPGVNPWSPDPSLSLEEIFTPETAGALRIEKIFDIFGDPRNEYVDVKWFDSNGKPNVEADPCNRPLQQSTVAEYEQRLFHSGLADDCSGYLAYVASFPDQIGSYIGIRRETRCPHRSFLKLGSSSILQPFRPFLQVCLGCGGAQVRSNGITPCWPCPLTTDGLPSTMRTPKTRGIP